MIITKNNFYANITAQVVIIKTINGLFAVYIIKNRKKTYIKFKEKSNKHKLYIISSPTATNFFINYNKTIQYNFFYHDYNFKKSLFLLKNKVKWNFIKFKYRGKGFKVKKFNILSKITFRLGKSHWTKIIYNRKSLLLKRTKKNTYCCISIRNNIFNGFKSLIQKVKGINKYTKRGIRLTRQFIKKRFGKISQASSVYK